MLVGLDNPLSNNPEDALVPWPVGCSGHRILQLLQTVDPTYSDLQYLADFERRNLYHYPASKKLSNQIRAWERLYATLKVNTVVIGLGSVVRDAMGLRGTRPMSFGQSNTSGHLLTGWMPHPSGRNHFYNPPEIKRQAGEFLFYVKGL